MKKTKIQEILDLSSLTMVDPEYTAFTGYIKTNRYHSARIFLEGFIEDKTENTNEDHDEQYVIDCERLDRLENLVLDLIISEEDVKHEYKPRRKRVRRSPVQ